jgi:hypothetical protein
MRKCRVFEGLFCLWSNVMNLQTTNFYDILNFGTVLVVIVVLLLCIRRVVVLVG